jgi:hypothetical protein
MEREEMKVYVVAYYYAHEGFDRPEAVFSSHEKALDYSKSKYEKNWREVEIIELELDSPPNTQST